MKHLLFFTLLITFSNSIFSSNSDRENFHQAQNSRLHHARFNTVDKDTALLTTLQNQETIVNYIIKEQKESHHKFHLGSWIGGLFFGATITAGAICYLGFKTGAIKEINLSLKGLKIK